MNTTKVRWRYFPGELSALVKRETDKYSAPVEISEKGGTQFVAHRGLSGLYRENTVSSFRAAAARSYYGVETDVHVTRDGKFVIIHDDSTGRVSKTALSVEGSTFDELRAVKLLVKRGDESVEGTRIPTLEEYVNACKEGGKICVLELKNHFEAADVRRIAEVVEECGYGDSTTYISFDAANLVNLREFRPNANVQFLSARYGAELLEFLKEHKFDLDIYFGELNKKNVDAMHAAGIKINCWTVDSPKAAKKLVALGVDYITTNILE